MWIYRKEELGESGAYEMNFLFNEGKFYIMDNHLAAAWCWIQKMQPETNYGFFHIDKHYDLIDNVSTELLNQTRQPLTKNFSEYFTGTFTEYLNIKFKETDTYPIARFDNYINIFRRLFPSVIRDYYFATHEDGTYLDEIVSYEVPIWDLHDNLGYWINDKKTEKWILNIDLDYFFLEKDSTEYQFLTDEYVLKICEEIQESISKIDVITIALSPEFCGGWDSAFRVLEIITNYFSIGFTADWK